MPKPDLITKTALDFLNDAIETSERELNTRYVIETMIEEPGWTQEDVKKLMRRISHLSVKMKVELYD